MTCRCGHDGEGPHPCHFNLYTCRKPAVLRLYNPAAVALAGMQMKVQMTETWACEECWLLFNEMLAAARERKPERSKPTP